jgi:hypothetical protein
MSFPSAPKNLPVLSSTETNNEQQIIFDTAKNKAFDNLFFILCDSWIKDSSIKIKPDLSDSMKELWQTACIEFENTLPEKQKSPNPQMFYRFNTSHLLNHDLLEGEDITPPTNSHGKTVTFTPSTILSQNSNDFRQYIQKQIYLPTGLILLSFISTDRKGKRIDWQYNMIITRDTKFDGKNTTWD